MPTPAAVKLADYAPPHWLINTVDLDVDIRAHETEVVARLNCLRNPDVSGEHPLVLDGEDLETLSLHLDGELLSADAYTISADRLVLNHLPGQFTLETRVRIAPDRNTQLSGLYRSRDGYFTQCEPQGFRRITWFADRPDVMARYTVTIHADKAAFPFLLSNGNPVGGGDEADGRHFAVWQDPFKKPSYLFALVAGKPSSLGTTT